MSMTVAEARVEIKNNFEKAELIEKRYPDGVITNAEDEKEVKRLLTDIDVMEAKLTALETAEERGRRIAEGLMRYTNPATKMPSPTPETDQEVKAKILSPGEQFVESYAYKTLKSNGTFNSPLNRVSLVVPLQDGTSLLKWAKVFEQKALLRGGSESSGGAFVQNDLQPGVVYAITNDLNIMTVIPRYQTTSDNVDFVREDTFTNAATGIAESTGVTSTVQGLKLQSTLAYSVCSEPVISISHWLPVTNRMLADAPQIRGIINQRLLTGLDVKVESEVITGSSTGNHLNGLLYAGIQDLPIGAYSLVDAIFHARTMVRTTGGSRANAIVMTPANWEEVRLARENLASGTLGGYLMGPPSMGVGGTLWGLPVIESTAMSANIVIVGDFAQGCGLFDREQASIRVGTIDDQFIRNQQTILAELRCAFVVFRPAAFCQITAI
jgi:HK97 family phage major capsid protein